MNAIIETLKKYGGDASSVVHFDEDVPGLLPYATLSLARANGDSDLLSLTAVYEWQQRPLLFVLDRDLVGNDSSRLMRVRRLLAMRGDAPYLALIGDGTMTVYQVGLDSHRASQAQLRKNCLPKESTATIPHLGNLRPSIAKTKWISDVILRLLTQSIDVLIESGTSDEDAISLVGRALFVRFLADRSLLPPGGIPDVGKEAHELFDSKTSARKTSEWLDATFNGDFLPLGKSVYAKLRSESFTALGNIVRRAPGGQLSLGWQERWDRLDFAHIPVGVLSQTYERYLSRHDPGTQRREGGFYTPRHIADLMARASFHALRQKADAPRATVLDPACGAGVFLLTAFRELVAERWRSSGVRPTTKTLREILYKQVSGFDINESALRFAALGLYLVSIELDPNPKPVSKLRFRNLRPAVLRWVGDPRISDSELGSLGPAIGHEHIAKYDLVLGDVVP